MTAIPLDILVRALAVLAAAATAHWLCRHASAALRAGIWTAALAGLLLLPAMARILPAWRVEVLQPAPAPLDASAPTPATVADVPVAEEQSLRSIAASTPASRPSDLTDAPSRVQVPSSPRPSAAFPWWTVLTLWIVVAVALLARIAISHLRLSRIARQAAPDADVELESEIQRIRLRLGITRDVSWRATDDVSVPAVTGFRRATLLLPADAASWPVDLKRVVVAHELAHVARWDAVGQTIAQAACAMYWFLPFVWLGARRAAILREQACDDAVLHAGVPPSTYATSLITLAQQAGAAPSAAAALSMASPSHIEERVMAILDPSVRRRAVTFPAAVALAVAGAGVVAMAAAIEPAHKVTLVGAGPVAITMESTPVLTTGQAQSEVRREPLAQAKARAQVEARADVQTQVEAHAQAQVLNQRTAAPQAKAQASSGLCGGDSESTSNSIHEDNGSRTWTIKLKSPRCSVDFRLDGKVEFNEDFTDIASISSGGFLRLDVTDNGVRHELELKPKGASVERVWRVDGREQPYDDAARTWLASFLIDLDRITAIGVDHRLPRLLRQGGVNAVLEETNQMRGEYARNVYYTKLAAAVKLSPAEVTRIIQQATALKTSDYYATQLLEGVGKSSGGDAAVRAAMVGLAVTLTSDYYMSESVGIITAHGPLTAGDMDALVGVVPRIKSDYYRAEVIRRMLKAGVPEGKTKTIIGAAADIKEDYYLVDALTAIASTRAIDESDLLMMVERGRRMSSDYYAAELLRTAATHKAATARVRQAAADAASRLSTYYRDEVRRAAGIKG